MTSFRKNGGTPVTNLVKQCRHLGSYDSGVVCMGLEKTHFSHTFYDCKLMATHIIAIAMMEAKA